MCNNSVRLMVVEDGIRQPATNMAFARDAVVSVVDLGSRSTVSIRAGEVSPYRHTLVVSGRTYRILNVFH